MQDVATKKFSELGVKSKTKTFVGEKMRLAKVLNTEIIVHFYEIKPSKFPERGSDDCLYLQISIDGKKYVAFSIAKYLMQTLKEIPEDGFPFSTQIVNNNDSYEFT